MASCPSTDVGRCMAAPHLLAGLYYRSFNNIGTRV
jgi:hypothetical protein